MNKDLAEIKAKIAKLISKEESSRQLGNLAEAEAFAAKIQELLLQYELSMEDFKKANTETTDVNKEKVDITHLMSSHEGTWIYKLYAACSPTNFCHVIMPYKWDYNYLTLIGTEINREFVHYMVNQLVSKIRQLSRNSFKEYKGPDKRNTYIRSFLIGAVAGIRERLNKDREEARKNTPQVNGLVLVKEANIAQFIKEHYPPGTLTKASVTSSSSAAGYSNGLEAGRGVSINKGVGASRGMGGTKLLN